METDKVEIPVPSGSTRDQIAKVVLGSLAGFAASKATEKLYDVAISAYRNRNV